MNKKLPEFKDIPPPPPIRRSLIGVKRLNFRAWDRAFNKMHYKLNLYSFHGNGEMDRAQLSDENSSKDIGNQVMVMSSIGQQDKHGKDIYELDILRIQGDGYLDGDDAGYFIVTWVKELALYYPMSPEEYFFYQKNGHIGSDVLQFLPFDEAENCEVCGNLFETPHKIDYGINLVSSKDLVGE